MSMPSDPEQARRSRLDDVLAEYMECVDRGEAGVRERLLAEHPDLAGELASYFESATTPDRRGGEAATSPDAR